MNTHQQSGGSRKYVALRAILTSWMIPFFICGCGPSDFPPYAPSASRSEVAQLEKTFGSPELKFSSSDCGRSYYPLPATPPGEQKTQIPPPVEIVRKDWVDAATLLVEAKVLSDCGISSMRGGYLVDGSKLTLGFSWVAGPSTSCGACQYELKYRLSNLKKQDYEISIKSVRQEKK